MQWVGWQDDLSPSGAALGRSMIVRGAGLLWMNDTEPEAFFKRIEVSITMEQRMPFFQAERCDQAVDSFAYRMATLSQQPIVLGSSNCQFRPASVEEMKLQKLTLDIGEGGISPNALQYLAKDQIG